MISSDLKIWLVSAGLALIVHGLVLVSWGGQGRVIDSTKISETRALYTTRLAFRKAVVEKPLADQPAITNRKPLQKKTIKKQNKISKIKNKNTENKLKKQLDKKTHEYESGKDLAHDKPGSTKKQIENTPAHASGQIAVLERQREEYFNLLIRHIEQHKFYPGSARRRGIEGKVEIRFVLNADGGISQLSTISKFRALKQAAAEAIKSALPMPLPGGRLSGSREIAFNMLYAMK